ncbi:unnamed protein product [Phytophthora fragariaefolia]|uniref:Unnamed protein product n=1 Tax=Phytophthora fragariaefolia TaxID=1490495 RepID=A0A9W6Y3W6_9STRA|nr:unnamed protein product [Phytophthora fragariaefolia]
MSQTERSPDIEYKHIAAIARRVISCRSVYKGVPVKIMKGDVTGAFRHLMLASEHVRWMAATIQELGVLIIDMLAPFGWTSSPAFYGAFGGAITWLVCRECPASMDPSTNDHEPFFAYEWVDDHVLVEPEINNRLHLANEALRLSMLAILGPAAINEEKLSTWETQLQVLGLEFDTDACTISMPQDKIAKALGSVHIYMDASNSGLAVLNPATRQYIQVQFDAEEQRLIQRASGCSGFNSNVREQLCVALAAWSFGPAWPTQHTVLIKAWSDNTSAVSWTNRLASNNPLAQDLNRAIGLAGAVFGFRILCGHLPGSSNTMADAGSRAWTPPYVKLWTNLSSAWQQIPVPPTLRKVYKPFSSSFSLTRWPLAQGQSTPRPGGNGRLGAWNTTSTRGYQQTANSTPINSP